MDDHGTERPRPHVGFGRDVAAHAERPKARVALLGGCPAALSARHPVGEFRA